MLKSIFENLISAQISYSDAISPISSTVRNGSFSRRPFCDAKMLDSTLLLRMTMPFGLGYLGIRISQRLNN